MLSVQGLFLEPDSNLTSSFFVSMITFQVFIIIVVVVVITEDYANLRRYFQYYCIPALWLTCFAGNNVPPDTDPERTRMDFFFKWNFIASTRICVTSLRGTRTDLIFRLKAYTQCLREEMTSRT